MADEEETGSFDYIAQRADAYATLLQTIAETKDPSLKKEGVLMLRAVRMSFNTLAQGQLTSVSKITEIRGHPL